MDFSRYLDWIKLSPRHLLPIFLFTGFVLFAPPEVLDPFGLTDLVARYRPVFGLVCALSATLLLSSGGMAIYDWSKGRRQEAQRIEQMRQEESQRLEQSQQWLHGLSEPEKQVLRQFLHNETTTRQLPMSDGVVGGLEAKGILVRSSPLGSTHFTFAYNIQPWAWEYLNSQPNLLE